MADLYAHRRLTLLRVLHDAVAYTLNEVVLRDSLSKGGFPCSVADLRDDLTHLRDRECVRVDTPGGVWLAELTATGADVAFGRAEKDGVARPGPGV